MAKRNREEVQDIALYHMEKLNRRNPSEEAKTLKDELKEASLTPEERRKRMPPGEWYRDLKDAIAFDKKCMVPNRLYQWVSTKFKEDVEKMRLDGSTFVEVCKFIRSKESDFLNI